MSSIFLRCNMRYLCATNFHAMAKNGLIYGRNYSSKLWNENMASLKTFQHRGSRVPIRRSGNTTISIKQYESSRKYTGLWKAERLVGVALVFMLPSAFCFQSKEFEMATAFVSTLHTYWGCESMCKDYVRSSVVGKVLPIVARSLNITVSLATLFGLYKLIYNDCGIVNMIKKFWVLGNFVPQNQE